MSMQKPKCNPVSRTAPDFFAERMEEFKMMFPESITEGKIDFDKLKMVLGEEVDVRQERYSFTWAGKKDAIRLLQVPSRATLIPVKEESISFDSTHNIFIEGDNLEVLKLLWKSYFGRVKMIYIDPPYNTGNDFIYRDDYTDPLGTYLMLSGQKDAKGNLLFSNPNTSGRYHSAWLSMMYPRLVLARQLLREDGIIFISIDDNEVHNLRLVMNEIFGDENFIATVLWQKIFSPKNTAKHFSYDHDYILVYCRDSVIWKPRLLPRSEEALNRYQNPDNDPRGAWVGGDLCARNYYSKGSYEVTSPSGQKFKNPVGTYWRVSYEKFMGLQQDNRISWGRDGKSRPTLKRFLSEVKSGIVPQTLWTHNEVGSTAKAKKELLQYVNFGVSENVLDTLKPASLIQRMLNIATNPKDGDIVLDFFAGSAPTAHAVLNQNRADEGNRQFICVQLPEPLPAEEKTLKTIADIGKQRIRNIISDMKKNTEGKMKLSARKRMEDLGFRLFKLTESNYMTWVGVEEKAPDAYTKQMELYLDPLIDGWTDENVIYELALKEGYSLTSRIEKVIEVAHNSIWKVTDDEKEQSFYVCLDDNLKEESIKSLMLNTDNLFICRDKALNDELAANLALQCNLKVI